MAVAALLVAVAAVMGIKPVLSAGGMGMKYPFPFLIEGTHGSCFEIIRASVGNVSGSLVVLVSERIHFSGHEAICEWGAYKSLAPKVS